MCWRCMQAYGAQAVVVSIDPRRVYVADPADTPRPTTATAMFGPHGEAFCWWQARTCVCCRSVQAVKGSLRLRQCR